MPPCNEEMQDVSLSSTSTASQSSEQHNKSQDFFLINAWAQHSKYCRQCPWVWRVNLRVAVCMELIHPRYTRPFEISLLLHLYWHGTKGPARHICMQCHFASDAGVTPEPDQVCSTWFWLRSCGTMVLSQRPRLRPEHSRCTNGAKIQSCGLHQHALSDHPVCSC